MLLYVTDEIETLLGLHQHFEGHGGYWHFWFIVFGSYRSCLNNVASEAIVDGAFMVSVINEGLYEFAASMLGLCTAQLQVMKQYFIRLFSICAGVCV